MATTLLRAIERSEIRRVGSESTVRVDVRILAATRRDLDKEVQTRRFRDDLFYRLAVGRVELPPLRRRDGDVGLLATHFWTQLGGDPGALPAETVRRWEAEDWPGNIRQLRNAVARALVLGDLDAAYRAGAAAPAGASPPASGARDSFLDDVIAERLPLPMARMRVVKEFEQHTSPRCSPSTARWPRRPPRRGSRAGTSSCCAVASAARREPGQGHHRRDRGDHRRVITVIVAQTTSSSTGTSTASAGRAFTTTPVPASTRSTSSGSRASGPGGAASAAPARMSRTGAGSPSIARGRTAGRA